MTWPSLQSFRTQGLAEQAAESIWIARSAVSKYRKRIGPFIRPIYGAEWFAERDMRDPPCRYDLVAPQFPSLSVHFPIVGGDHSPHPRTFVRLFFGR
jgi:hypothetical protein